MNRLKLTIQYDGTLFHGWQKQSNLLTAQGCIEDALKIITKEDCVIYGASRTDAGVHAIMQVAHTDIRSNIDIKTLQRGLNFFLKKFNCSVSSVNIVSKDFHARFSSKSKTYDYKIICSEYPIPFFKNRAWLVRHDLDTKKMLHEAKSFLGTNNLKSFTKGENARFERSIDSILISETINYGTREIVISISARSFMHNQIRIMVGSLYEVSLKGAKSIQAMIAAEDRREAGLTAPPQGLYLSNIKYD